MATEIKSFSRKFQIWLYTVGHSQLLLRSPKDDTHPTRVDVLFKDVGGISLPTVMDGLSFSEATDEEMRQPGFLPDILNRPDREDRKVFLVRGHDFSGFVIAGAVFWHEDMLEYYDKSYFSHSWEIPTSPFYRRVYLGLKIRASILLHRMKQAMSSS